VLVYDLDRKRSYCLNRTAAFIWRRCDGRTTVQEMASKMQQELRVPADEEAVWLALDRLGRADLLRERLVLPANAAHYTRRTLVRRLATAGGLALVTSVLTPEAQAAGSACTANTCVTPGTCCCICANGSNKNKGCQSSANSNAACAALCAVGSGAFTCS
jgi:hypothetical protein